MSIAISTASPTAKPDFTVPAVEIRWTKSGLLGSTNSEVYVGNGTTKGDAGIVTAQNENTGLKGVFSIGDSKLLVGSGLAGSEQAREAVKTLFASLEKLGTKDIVGRPSYNEPELVGDWFAVGVAAGNDEPIKWYELSPRFDAGAADVISAAKLLHSVVLEQGN